MQIGLSGMWEGMKIYSESYEIEWIEEEWVRMKEDLEW